MNDTVNPETIAILREMEVQGEEGFLAEIIAAFNADTRKRLDAIRKAQASRDWTGLAQSAHAVKGSAFNLGADQFATKMHTLERTARDHQVVDAKLIDEVEAEYQRVREALNAYLK